MFSHRFSTALCLFCCGIAIPLLAPVAKATPVYLSRSPVDLSLLKAGIKTFWQTPACVTQSTLTINGSSTGVSFTGKANLQALSQLPNQFRVEVEFAPQDTGQSQRVVLVSDGETFTAFRPDLNQYMQSPAKDFQGSDNNFWVGFSTLLFLSMPPETPALFQAGTASSETLFQTILQELQALDLSESKAKLAGQETVKFSLNNKTDNLVASIYLLPPQGRLKAIDFETESQGIKIQIQEIIQQRDCQASIPNSQFKFLSPPGSQQVKKVEISPF
ncbi:DUF2092 domain-containing protein [Thermosynechococcaceae cyanobacterium BACA0444]|uniref:DUF2092 domain-containing protein n=1 Tax=Pseudocalidococcus azoricus BACA0444 TaxID=2918990 RepID=A0AAE4FTF6_9CYAN|nr:DUF2092 domain-containing protein [Pseudocalidococcus azoricus]MDS3861232.1 DUF2092 domain-containing protein [Pseudocalidococcus azoricus BACA0444]